MLQFVKPLLDRAGVETNVGFANLAETSNLFHMSWAKNTSHQMAINHLASHPLPASTSVSGLPSDIGGVVYVNLDADNSIGPKFIETLVAAFISPRTAAVHCRGFEDGTCGRLAVRANTFQQLGGYDQEPDVLPSGYQDIDLKLRIGRYFNKPVSLLAVQNKKEPAMHEVIGYAAPNAEDKKADRGSAKIAKVSNPNHQTWGQMNAVNSQTMSRKAARGPVRNNDRLGYGLGWPCRVVTLEELPIGKDVAAAPCSSTKQQGRWQDGSGCSPPSTCPSNFGKDSPSHQRRLQPATTTRNGSPSAGGACKSLQDSCAEEQANLACYPHSTATCSRPPFGVALLLGEGCVRKVHEGQHGRSRNGPCKDWRGWAEARLDGAGFALGRRDEAAKDAPRLQLGCDLPARPTRRLPKEGPSPWRLWQPPWHEPPDATGVHKIPQVGRVLAPCGECLESRSKWRERLFVLYVNLGFLIE